jgi:hypothetical protein
MPMKSGKKKFHHRFTRRKSSSASSSALAQADSERSVKDQEREEGGRGRRLYVKLTPMVRATQTIDPRLGSIVYANDERHPVPIDNDWFTGVVCIRVREFGNGWTPVDPHDPKRSLPPITGSKYFDGHRRQFSLQVMGRFKQPFSGDDVLFGTWFDKPLRLPHGWSLAVGIAQRIDASMVYDLGRPDPYLCSPLICAMNTVRIVAEGVPLAYSHDDIAQNHWDYWDGKRLEENLPLLDTDSLLLQQQQQKRRQAAHCQSAPTTPTASRRASHPQNRPPQLRGDGESEGEHDEHSDLGADLSKLTVKGEESDDNDAALSGHSQASITSGGSEHSRADSKHSITSANQGGIMGLLFGASADRVAPSSHSAHARRRHYLDPERRRAFTYDTATVYSWDFYSPYVDVARMRVKLGISIDLTSYLNDQPITYYARSRQDPSKIFFRIEIGQQ